MSNDSGLNVLILSDQLRWGYGTFTFPALRYLLDHLGDGSAIAVGAEDAAGNPVGLLLGNRVGLDEGGQAIDLMSIYVHPASRGKGVATRLLSAFTSHCQAQDFSEIRVTYMTGQPTTEAFESLLARVGWAPPETRMLVVQATLDSISRAPWIKQYPLADNMQIVNWLDLTEEDRAGIVASQLKESWIPADLYPFDHEANCEPITSLALKLDGQIVGWAINHRVGTVLRYTCSFMHRRLQRMARVLLLYNESVARMPRAGFDTGMWTIPVWHPSNAAFARRWMAPYSTRFDETRSSVLKLS